MFRADEMRTALADGKKVGTVTPFGFTTVEKVKKPRQAYRITVTIPNYTPGREKMIEHLAERFVFAASKEAHNTREATVVTALFYGKDSCVRVAMLLQVAEDDMKKSEETTDDGV